MAEDGETDPVEESNGNNAMSRIRQAPQSHSERMKSLYVND